MADTKQNGQEVAKGDDALTKIPINKIRENKVRLREVDKESEKYLGLVDSIKNKGILNPIVVTEYRDPENAGQFLYGLVDGLHRYNAALDCGLSVIPVHVKNMEQEEIEETQLIANYHKVDTKPIQYTKQLERLMMRNPLMTISELAKRLSVSGTWLSQRFGLLDLDEKIQPLVDEGRLKLANAFQLAKLPVEEQTNFLDRALTQQPDEFGPAVANRMKEIKEARRQGRTPGQAQFEPVPHQRKWAEIKNEHLNKQLGPVMINKHNVTDPVQAWNLAIDWCSNMDPDARASQIAENDKRKKDADDAKRRRELEREEKKAKEAADRAEAIRSAQHETATA